MNPAERLRYLTINTDASYHPETGASGYAFYIVCNLFKISKGGNFKYPVANPMDAEMKCIGNALATLMAQEELPDIDIVVINSDCKPAFHHMGHNTDHPVGKKIRGIINDLKIRVDASSIEFRHVKAHTGSPAPRSKSNNRCDLEAKRWMRKEHNEILKQRTNANIHTRSKS